MTQPLYFCSIVFFVTDFRMFIPLLKYELINSSKIKANDLSKKMRIYTVDYFAPKVVILIPYQNTSSLKRTVYYFNLFFAIISSS